MASIAFGLVATTVMVLFLIPVLYVIFNDWGWTRQVSEEIEPAPEELAVKV